MERALQSETVLEGCSLFDHVAKLVLHVEFVFRRTGRANRHSPLTTYVLSQLRPRLGADDTALDENFQEIVRPVQAGDAAVAKLQLSVRTEGTIF